MVEFVVDGVAYECGSISKIDVGYSADDLKDVTAGRTRSDISVTITSSQDNWNLLKAELYPHCSSKFNYRYRTGELQVDSQTIFDGEAVLNRVEWSADEITMTFTILGDTDSWAHAVALSTFNSIPIEFEKQMLFSTITDSWSEGEAVSFLPVTRDEVSYEVSSTQGYSIIKVRGVDDYHPFLHVKSLVDAIFSATEYSVESAFMESDFFKRLYISGSYAHSESDTAHTRMGFYLCREGDTQTTAAYGGRVYASPYISFNSVGNLVDLSTIESRDDCYSNGGALSESSGAVGFTPIYSTNVGFEFRFAYVATCRVESRTTLSTFDRIYVGDSIQFEFTMANCWVDLRDTTLDANFTYTLFAFDHTDNTQYKLVDATTGVTIQYFTTSSTTFTTSSAQSVKLLYLSGISYVDYPNDWVVYSGWVAEQSELEIDVTFTSPPSYMSVGQTHTFDNIIFDGGEQGDTFILLERTSIRAIFASYPGYGSYFSFEDIGRHDITQGDFLSSLQHLFNLCIYTDSSSGLVYIEPRDDFYGDDLWDWTIKIIESEGVEFSPLAQDIYKSRTWRYQSGEASMEQYLDCSVDEYGVWSSTNGSYVAIEGSKTYYNSLLYPSVNDSDGVLYIGERYDDTTLDTLNITPRIVQRVGYCQTTNEGELPYATFHDGEDTLCFENRDGLQGLNQYYSSEVGLSARSDKVTCSVYLTPEEFNSLFTLGNSSAPSIRSRFSIALNGEVSRVLISAIEWYNPDDYLARITFMTID